MPLRKGSVEFTCEYWLGHGETLNWLDLFLFVCAMYTSFSLLTKFCHFFRLYMTECPPEAYTYMLPARKILGGLKIGILRLLKIP